MEVITTTEQLKDVKQEIIEKIIDTLLPYNLSVGMAELVLIDARYTIEKQRLSK